MEYRINRRTGDKIGILGFGSSVLGQAGAKEGVETLRLAFEGGVNYYDLAAGGAACFAFFGEALAHVREQVFYQIHFGANYATGSYGWTTDLETIKRSVDWQLAQLKTDYIDYGFIHCIDEEEDFAAYTAGGALAYVQAMKAQGVVRHIGLSTHAPALAQKALDTGLIDMLMFSVNPGYDECHGEFARGSASERAALYRRCEAEGVGISVMKAFSGGQLLDAKTSPFGRALTAYQCMQYALDKPGVLTVLPGIRNSADMRQALGFLTAPREARAYDGLDALAARDTTSACVYCGHCQPCPSGLEIGLINKYYDLARAGDKLAAGHYSALKVRADACAACGHCNARCPFQVDQVERMREISAYFWAQSCSIEVSS